MSNPTVHAVEPETTATTKTAKVKILAKKTLTRVVIPAAIGAAAVIYLGRNSETVSDVITEK